MNNKFTVRDLSRVAIFAALIAVLGLPGQIPLAAGVPITAQTLGVMLAGAILGSWRGALSVIVFEILVAAGLPLLSGGRGGIGVFFGPTVGYLIGWIVGAWIIGAFVNANKSKPTVLRTFIGLVLGGIVAVYALGIPGFMLVNHLPSAALPAVIAGNSAFLIGDSIKVVLTGIIVFALYRAYPKAFKN